MDAYAFCHCCCIKYPCAVMYGLKREPIPIAVCPTCKRTDYQERLEGW